MGYTKYENLGKNNEDTEASLYPLDTIQNEEELRQLTSKYPIVVVDIYADWCGPCKHITPQFQKLAAKYKDNNNVKFVKDNITNDDSYHSDLVNAVPYFFIYKKGQVVFNSSGGGCLPEIEQIVNDNLNVELK